MSTTSISDDWKQATVGDLCSFSNGHGFRPPDWTDHGLPIIRIQNLNGSKNFNYFAGEPEKDWLVEPGTMLFAWAGTRGVSFGPTIWNGPLGVLNQHIFRVKPKKSVVPDWLFLALEAVTWEIERRAHGFKATLVHVRRSDITKQKILLPPIAEQQKIVHIISTWDEAIAKTKRLIAALRERKKGLMQQLLTGHIRFAGFAGEWKTIKFSEVLNLRIGRTPERNQPAYWDTSKKTGNVWLSISDLSGKFIADSKEYISDEGIKASGASLVPKETVLMSFKLTIGRVAIPTVDVYTNEAICALMPKDKSVLYSHYLYHAISAVRFDKELDQAVKGQTLNLEKIRRLELSLPNYDEQIKIAECLDYVDDELAMHEKYLALLQQQKKGLMQRLLTGQVRVTT